MVHPGEGAARQKTVSEKNSLKKEQDDVNGELGVVSRKW